MPHLIGSVCRPMVLKEKWLRQWHTTTVCNHAQIFARVAATGARVKGGKRPMRDVREKRENSTPGQSHVRQFCMQENAALAEVRWVPYEKRGEEGLIMAEYWAELRVAASPAYTVGKIVLATSLRSQ